MKTGRLISAALIPVLIGLCFVKCWSQPALYIQAEPTSPRPPVEIKFREMRFGKPPLVYMFFDVVLRNHRAESRWFLLPSNLGTVTAASQGGVDTLEVYAPRGTGRVPVGRFLGRGGFQALLLPAGAEVRLRLFPVSFWGDLPDQLQIEVVTAKRLTVGGEEAAVWFGVDPATSVKADIAENPRSWTHVSSRSTPDGREVAVLVEEDDRIKLQVPLGEKKKDRPRNAKSDKLSEIFIPGDCRASTLVDQRF